METTHVNNESYCSACNKLINAASHPTKKPKPEDISICINCGTLHKFDDSLKSIPLTEQEIDELKENKTLWDQIEIVQKEISKRPINIYH